MAAVHTALPDDLTTVVAAVLGVAAVEHVAHGVGDPVGAASVAAADERALALIGPFRSRDVAEALEATAPAGLPLLAPVATWAGVTRSDEPGCEDPAAHRGTVLRMVARDTVVAARIAGGAIAHSVRAHVVAGEHEYGVQLDGQLRLAGLPRADAPGDADFVVLCGLAGEPEVARAIGLGMPTIAFDGVQGGELGGRDDVRLALPFGDDAARTDGSIDISGGARRAAELVVAALASGARDRSSVLAAVRQLGPFDASGDPIDPPVWLWRAGPDWTLRPDRPL
jgi:hypothetical protein